MSFSNGRVHQGSILVAGDSSGVDQSVISGLASGATLQNPAQLPFDFQSEFTDLRAKSVALSGADANGQIEYLYGGIRLTGDCSSDVQVFNLVGSNLQNSNHATVNCIPGGATIVLNVRGGGNLSVQNIGFQPLNPWANKLIWNFYAANGVFFANSEIPGLVFAPAADVNTTWGAINGTVIAKSWNGSYSL